MAASERPLVFTNQGMQLVGMLHRPEGAGRFPAVTFFHGCTASRVEARWIFVEIARALADRGIMVLRFDFRHSGESQGRFEDMTLSGEVSDGIRSLDVLCADHDADPGRIGVLGASFGGAVAVHVAARMAGRIRSCALINPVSRPYDDIRAISGVDGIAGLTFPVEYNGFLFGRSFVEELHATPDLDVVGAGIERLLVINGSGDTVVGPDGSRDLVNTVSRHGGSAEHRIIDGADHTFSRVVWRRQVVSMLCDWFLRTLDVDPDAEST